MTRHRSNAANAARWLMLLALPVFGACSDGAEPEEPAAEAAEPGPPSARGARTLPIPGSQGGLPEGHPPIGGAAMAWDVPDTWTVEPPSSSMRQAQYRVPGPGGDGECVVFYFGPGQGGDPLANAQRWAGQFEQPDGSSSVDVMKTGRVEGALTTVMLVEVTGTYAGGMTGTMEPAPKKPGYMLLGAIADGPDAPWFFKFTGPEETVRAQRETFETMLRSVRPAS